MATQYIERFSSVSQVPSNLGSSNHGAAGIGVVGDYVYVNGARLGEVVYGDHFYLSQYSGSDGNDGKSFNNPYATWTKALANVTRGSVLHVYGWLEAAAGGEVTLTSTPDVTVIGHGTRTRPGRDTNNEELGPKGGSAEMTSNASATAPTLTVRSQGWRFINMTFDGHASYPIIRLERNADGETAVTGYNAGHAEFINCTFVGPSTYGIQDSGGNVNIGIYGCNFYGFSTTGNIAIGGIVGAGIGFREMWEIVGNRFHSNLTDINLSLSGANITHNHFKLISNTTGATVTNTVAINTSPDAAGRNNWIALNHMHAAQNHNGVNARFVPGTNDMFAENYWSDIAEYGEPAS